MNCSTPSLISALPPPRLVLEKFCIGELAEADREGGSGAIVQYQDDTAEGQFYEVLKRRVEKYFRGNEVCRPKHMPGQTIATSHQHIKQHHAVHQRSS